MTADASSTPAAEVEIDEALVRRLLREQYPQFANMPVRIMEAGWDNVMVRLGDDLALRLPRRAAAEPLILNEQRWLPILAPDLPLDIPVPLHCGIPQAGYPFHWSILKWIEGEAADLAPPDDDQARVAARFLAKLHRISLPETPPANPHRDCSLLAKQTDIEKRMAKLKEIDSVAPLLTPQLIAAWQKAIAEPAPPKSAWAAGDVHARNVLVSKGKITAFIDWGDMCAGDPASDLACIWALFNNASARLKMAKEYGMSESLLIRAMGWAIFYGVLLTETGMHDTPRHYAMGKQTLQRINADLSRGAIDKLST